MSTKLYSIFGINTEEDLEKTKVAVMQSLKKAKAGSIADNAIFFSYGATGFIDIFPDHNEIRGEVQADDEESKDKAQQTLQEHLFNVLEVDPENFEGVWRDITDSVLSDKARVAAEKAQSASTTDTAP
jgi:hypothetical protein